MSQLHIHGNEYRLLALNEKQLPTLETPCGELDEWFRLNVLPKLDIRPKWCGCWMWTGGHTSRGEPKISLRDTFTRKHGRIGRLQTVTLKHEIVKQYIDFKKSKLPGRRFTPPGEVEQVELAKPDLDVVHLCEQLSCLNPAHFLVSLADAKWRDVKKLRDLYLVPGTYYPG